MVSEPVAVVDAFLFVRDTRYFDVCRKHGTALCVLRVVLSIYYEIFLNYYHNLSGVRIFLNNFSVADLWAEIRFYIWDMEWADAVFYELRKQRNFVLLLYFCFWRTNVGNCIFLNSKKHPSDWAEIAAGNAHTRVQPSSRSRLSSTIRRTTSASETSSLLARAFSHLNWTSVNQIPLCLAILAPVFGMRTSPQQGGVVK